MGNDKKREQFKTKQALDRYHQQLEQRVFMDILQSRLDCYKDIERVRGLPLLVYATKFIGNVLPGTPNGIILEDVDGFTDIINSVDKKHEEVDVLVHSPGGDATATQRIVGVLRERFKKVHFLIPHSAYSAATLLALSGNSIVMHPSATLGPIDPQIGISRKNGIHFVPTRSVIDGFDEIRERIRKDGIESVQLYYPLMEGYSLDIFMRCKNAENLSKELAELWLKEYMFAEDMRDKSHKIDEKKIAEIVNYFSDHNIHKTHSRPLMYSAINPYLKGHVDLAKGELKTLLWEAYILLSGFFNNSPTVKIFENSQEGGFGTVYKTTHNNTAS